MTTRSLTWTLLGPAVRGIDRQLRRRQGIVEFSDDPDCVYRIRFAAARRDVRLPDGLINKGDPVVEFHWWNERLPRVGEEGPGLAWGVRMLRMTVHTLSLMAEELERNPRWSGVRAICGTTARFAADSAGWERRLARLGYTMVAHDNVSGAFVEFWERVWAWALWQTYQAGTKAVLKPSQISRTDVWMSAAELKRRFAAGGTGIGLKHAARGEPDEGG